MLSQPELLGIAWIISTFTFALLWITFIVLFAIEWRQRVKEEKEHDREMAKIITDYEHRMVETEKDVQHNADFIEMLIGDSNLISQEIKNRLINDFRANKGRAKLPFEQT